MEIYRDIRNSSICMERETQSGSENNSIKASIKQTKMNHLGKHPYSKNKDLFKNFEMPSDHLTRK